MSSPSIYLFNPFDLQHGSDESWHLKLQKVIYYVESRFCQAVTCISKVDPQHHLWMQNCLRNELVCWFFWSTKHWLTFIHQVFMMSYFGIATSLNIIIEVPIVVQSLSLSLLALSNAELLIPFDLKFITMLDTGTIGQGYSCIINSYVLSWWQGTHQPAEGGSLSGDTVDHCLEHHHCILLETPTSNSPRVIPSSSPQLSTPTLLHMRSNVSASHGASNPPTGANTSSASANCPQCTSYKSMASSLLTEVQGLKHFISGMTAQLSTDTKLIWCQAVVLYTLHEKVLQNELLSESLPSLVKPSVLATKKGKVSEQVCLNVENKLKQICTLPTGHISGPGDQPWVKLRFSLFSISARGVSEVAMKQNSTMALFWVNHLSKAACHKPPALTLIVIFQLI